MKKKIFREFPRLCLCLIFPFILNSCTTKREVASRPTSPASVKTANGDEVFELEVNLSRVSLRSVSFGNIRAAIAQPFDVKNDFREMVTDRDKLILHYRFSNQDDLQELEDELLATGMVTGLRVSKLRIQLKNE
jgi:hypothetical protein